MTRDSIIVLGIPVDNLTMDETIDRIFAMVDTYQIDRQPRQIATVNVDFMVNTLSWFSSGPRHPELLEILRKADLVTVDGMPIVWASKLLGAPLKERVTGADLVPRLAEEAAHRSKSIFFLGGQGDVGERAAALLKKNHPNLTVSGTASPFVYTDGKAMGSADTDDTSTIEQINGSGADILLIGFGNPKQEVWFERNRHRLKIPVSIGIGGTYEFITGSVARAPVWMQKSGLEWIFRITQDPGRLWKRYVIGFFKFGLMILPAVLDHHYKRILYKKTVKPEIALKNEKSSLQRLPSEMVKVITIPGIFDTAVVEEQKERIVDNTSNSQNVVLDLSGVNFIDSSGIGLIVTLKRKLDENNKKLFLIGISKKIQRTLEINRIFDLFKDLVYDDINSIKNVIENIYALPPFFYIAIEKTTHVLVKLFGTLDAAQMTELEINAIFNQIGNSNCIFDLSGLSFVDSSGIMLFLKTHKQVAKHNKTFVVFGLKKTVLQMFRITKLDRFFTITDNEMAAEKLLKENSL